MIDSSNSSLTSSSDSFSSSDGSKSSDDFFLEFCTISILLSECEVKHHQLRVAWEDHDTILQIVVIMTYDRLEISLDLPSFAY